MKKFLVLLAVFASGSAFASDVLVMSCMSSKYQDPFVKIFKAEDGSLYSQVGNDEFGEIIQNPITSDTSNDSGRVLERIGVDNLVLFKLSISNNSNPSKAELLTPNQKTVEWDVSCSNAK